MDCTSLGVPGVGAGGLVGLALASTSASFLLAAVSMVTKEERAKFDTLENCGVVGRSKGQVVEGCPQPVNGCGRGWGNSMGATQWTPHPRRLKLALAFEVGQMEGNLSGSLCVVDGREALPITHLLRKVLSCKDGSQGHHHQFKVSHGHASLLCFLLDILRHDDELGDAIHLDVVLGHVQAEGDCENLWLLGLINCEYLVADCLVARH